MIYQECLHSPRLMTCGTASQLITMLQELYTKEVFQCQVYLERWPIRGGNLKLKVTNGVIA